MTYLMMKFTVLTLFPDMFAGPLSESIIKRAKEKGLIDINLVNFRDFATDRHHTVDDTPYGGGPGMLIKIDVIDTALQAVRRQSSSCSENCLQGAAKPKRQSLQDKKDCLCPPRKSKTVLLTPGGVKFDQKKAYEYSELDELILIAGHYEGFDQRIHDHLVDEELSIGDFVLTGGELPAMMVIDAVTRLLPGAIRAESLESETHNSICHPERSEGSHYLQEDSSPPKANQNDVSVDFPQYTRPAEYNGWKVPDVLVSGNHAEIKKWRERQK